MRLIERIGAGALAILAAFVACAAGATPLETLEACSNARPASTRGLEALAAQCPSLESALSELGYTTTLPEGWRERLTRAQLAQLASLATHERPGVAQRPDLARLKGILERLARERAAPSRSWWESLEDWMRSWFSRSDRSALSWLERWLDRLSSVSGVLTIVTYVLVVAFVVGSLLYVVLELRSTGAFARLAAPRRGAGAAASLEPPPQAVPTGAGALEQPALLLALIVRRLNEAGRLVADRHLTHRELARAARLDHPDQHRRLTRLADVAETILYGAHPPAPPIVASALADGRELLESLRAPGAAGAST